MKGYILQNDEQGWMTECPVYVDKEKAELDAADKCRHYSVIELDYIIDCEPCHPLEKYSKCEVCCRFTGVKRR